MKQKIIFCLLLMACALPQAISQTAVWDTLPIAFNEIPRFMYEDSVNDLLYIGGGFWQVNGDSVNQLIGFNGHSFSEPAVDSLGNPVFMVDTPNGMMRVGDSLIVYGLGIVSYCHNSWSWLDQYNAWIWSAMPYQGNLAFGGLFSTIGLDHDTISSIALWKGNAWEEFLSINQILDDPGAGVIDMIEFQNQLFIAGNFTEPGGLNEIIRWDGQQWRDVGGGIPNSSGLGAVKDMIIYQGDLYVGGIFTKAGGAPGNNIARWNGNSWDDVGGGVGIKAEGANSVEQMVVYNDNLWVTGSFLYAGGVPAKFLARWDGERWYGLGDATSFTHVLGVYHDTLYTTTGIKYPDGKTRAHLIKLLHPDYYDTASAPVSTSIHQPPPKLPEVRLSRLPDREHMRVDFQDALQQPGEVELQVIDQLGRLIWSESIPASSRQYDIPISQLAAGVYVLRVGTASGEVTKLFWKETR